MVVKISIIERLIDLGQSSDTSHQCFNSRVHSLHRVEQTGLKALIPPEMARKGLWTHMGA